MSHSEETYKQKKPEFLEAAIEQLNQYSLAPEQSNKIRAILENIASGNFEQTFNFEKTVIQPVPLCQMMDSNTAALPNEIWLHLYSLLDLQSCQTLFVVDHQFHLFSQHYVLKSFPRASKNVEIIDTRYGELPISSKLKIIKLVEKTNPETMKHFKCLIMRQGFCFTKLMKYEKSRRMQFIIPNELKIFLKTLSEKKTYPIFISNKILPRSGFAECDEDRQNLLESEGCELPTFLELFAFKIFNREKHGPFMLSSTNFGDEPPKKIMIHLSENIDQNLRSYPIMRINENMPKNVLLCMHGKLK